MTRKARGRALNAIIVTIVATALTVLLSCRSQSGSGDSSSHWLSPCRSKAECGALECVCGVCTRGCSNAGDCTALAAQASCIATSEAHPSCSVPEPRTVCDATCRSNDDCSGIGAAPYCVEGHCRGNPVDDASATLSDARATDATTSTDGGAAEASDGAMSGGGPPPSCQDLPATCGPNGNEDCCTSPTVTGGTFWRSYDGVTFTDRLYPATISDFGLDKFEVTVGRFREFVAAFSQNMIPAGAGKNANNATDPGWDVAWNASLPVDGTALQTFESCGGDWAAFQTWTASPGPNENQPINCVNWYEAFAFCIWDGGRLPTKAEWNYAAAGGSEQRVYPWGSTALGMDATLAVWGCFYNGNGTCTGASNIAPVGSVSAGNGKYGQADLAGNLSERTLDGGGAYSNPCRDCADTAADMFPNGAGTRGGSFAGDSGYWGSAMNLTSSYWDAAWPPGFGHWEIGFRCARNIQ